MSVDVSQVANEAALQGLRAFDEGLVATGIKKHDRADMLINACIGHGITAGTEILATLVRLGFDRKHAGIRLAEGIKLQPVWPEWGRHTDGVYWTPALPSAET